jgi:lipoma-prefererred partner
MQKEALEYHKKMLETQMQQPNNSRFYGATPQPQIGGTDRGGGNRIYENTAPSVALAPKVNAQSQQHIGYDGLIYSNIIHGPDDDLPPPPLDFQTSDPCDENSINCSDLPSEEELPPPSPVSSSYSELRRAIDNKYQPVLPPPNANYHHHGNTSTAEYVNLPPPIPSQGILHTVGGGSYDTRSQSDSNPQSFYGGLSNYNADYGTYGPSSQSSTYESIYEPITPRNSSQMSNRPNCSIYAPYSSGTGTNSGIATPTPSQAGGKPKESVVDQLTNLLMQSLNHGEPEDADSFGE